MKNSTSLSKNTRTSNSLKSLEGFVQNLRKYQKESILNFGTALAWTIYREKKRARATAKEKKVIHLLEAYTPRVIMLALATCNNCRSKLIENKDTFYNLCFQYLNLNIPTSISDKDFRDQEAVEIFKHLEGKSIPPKYLDQKIIRSYACSSLSLFLQRSAVEQNQHCNLRHREEMYADYLILKRIDDEHEGLATTLLEQSFNLSIKQIFRSGIELFELARKESHNGFLEMNKISCDSEEILESLLSQIDVKEAGLYEEWYKETVLGLPFYYQRYAPTPLTITPVIHLNKSNRESRKYLIPSPESYIRGFRQAVFSRLFRNHDSGKMGNILGNSIEDHILYCLVHIFGKERVQKIDHSGKKADFLISLNHVDLIIESKSHIGSFTDRMVFSPESVARVWNHLYSACTQCSASITQLKKKDRPTVAIVLVADHITAEHFTFQKFGQKTGLLKDMEIDVLECVPWNGLESILWKTSIDCFEKALLEKIEKEDSWEVEDLLSLPSECSDAVSKYDYLETARKEIFEE